SIYQLISRIYQMYMAKYDLGLKNYKCALDFQKQMLTKKYLVDTVVTINDSEQSIKTMEEWLARKE
ncbi:unnamed protein product, partial [Rotaria sp. Silwood1]